MCITVRERIGRDFVKNRKDSMSKFISLVLRHHPDAAYIQLDEHGWADVEKLLAGIKKNRKKNKHGVSG